MWLVYLRWKFTNDGDLAWPRVFKWAGRGTIPNNELAWPQSSPKPEPGGWLGSSTKLEVIWWSRNAWFHHNLLPSLLALFSLQYQSQFAGSMSGKVVGRRGGVKIASGLMSGKIVRSSSVSLSCLTGLECAASQVCHYGVRLGGYCSS